MAVPHPILCSPVTLLPVTGTDYCIKIVALFVRADLLSDIDLLISVIMSFDHGRSGHHHPLECHVSTHTTCVRTLWNDCVVIIRAINTRLSPHTPNRPFMYTPSPFTHSPHFACPTHNDHTTLHSPETNYLAHSSAHSFTQSHTQALILPLIHHPSSYPFPCTYLAFTFHPLCIHSLLTLSPTHPCTDLPLTHPLYTQHPLIPSSILFCTPSPAH